MENAKGRILNNFEYTQDDNAADVLYRKFKEIDPFPTISSALLNSADIADYVRETGLICPFSPSKLKPSSYEMDLGGEVLYWDKEGEEANSLLQDNGEIVLRKNSITFVTVNATFRLPDYIALRFNLQIEHVHKGILLGTGPLVNPGFCGQLMIPLHNLTNNDYKIKAGDPLIGVEFTKLSEVAKWDQGEIAVRSGEYIQNEGKKSTKKFLDYIKKHVPHGMIVQSSLSDTINNANIKILENEELLSRTKKTLNVYSITATVGVFVALITMYGLISDSNKYVADASTNLYKNMEKSVHEYVNKYLEITHKDRNLELSNQIEQINLRYKIIQNKIIDMEGLKQEEIRILRNENYQLKKQLSVLNANKTQNNNNDTEN